jgi:1-deoxy-D-xylulose-5-phosphate reductoisomerase
LPASGGTAPCVLNAANEVAVMAFLSGRLPFDGIAAVVDRTLEAVPAQRPGHFDDLFDADALARGRAAEIVERQGGALSSTAGNGGPA